MNTQRSPKPNATRTLFWSGVSAALRGFVLATRTPSILQFYTTYVIAIAAAAALIFAALIALTFWLLSVWALPGVVYWTLLILSLLLSGLFSPVLAVVGVNFGFPLLNERIFFAALAELDPERARQWQSKPSAKFGTTFWIHLRILAFALFLGLCSTLLGLIPVVGAPLGLALGLYATTRTLALEMSECIWARTPQPGVDTWRLWRSHRASLLGYGLPWAPLASIPLVNGALFGLCQAGAAQWAHDCLPSDVLELDSSAPAGNV
jgi:uncharacterized protein involved in cysteine biosynthesis